MYIHVYTCMYVCALYYLAYLFSQLIVLKNDGMFRQEFSKCILEMKEH